MATEAAREKELEKNLCEQCVSEKNTGECQHKRSAKTAGNSGGDQKAETPGQESQAELLKQSLGFEYNADKESGIFTISLHNHPKLTPETKNKFEQELMSTWTAFREKHKDEFKNTPDLISTTDAKGNKTITMYIPSALFNKFIQTLADNKLIPEAKAKEIQQQHDNFLNQPQKSLSSVRTPYERMMNPRPVRA